jgi:hypothetical protein
VTGSAKVFGGSGMPSGVCTVARRSAALRRVGLKLRMMELSYRRHRFLPVVIQHAVWVYLRFTLSYRDVEDLLAERGLDISYETVRNWVLKFGSVIARRLRGAPSPPEQSLAPGRDGRSDRRQVAGKGSASR